MNEELKKALEALIEETITEIDELKKSRFAASEIKIEGPGDGIDGKPTNGHIEKEEDEKEDEEEEDKDMDKAKGKNKEADPGSVHKEEDCAEKSEGKNKEADPGSVHKAEDKEDEDKEDKDAKGGEEHEKKERKAIKQLANLADMDKAEDKMGYMKGAIAKSQEEVSSLMKSYIDEKVLPLENKLASLLDLVTKIADQPVAPKGATARYQALTKSADGEEKILSKSEVSSKLFELKKSGSEVDTMDVTKAELGQDLQAIVKKYNLA